MIQNAYSALLTSLQASPRTWLVTGAAGFIGSHLIEELLNCHQTVIGVDNFSTGQRKNLNEVRAAVGPHQWDLFSLLDADVRNFESCQVACRGVDVVLHQAALGSVPRSIEDPLATNANNVTGFLNVLVAAKEAKVRRFVYATSSATYGDHPALPKVESAIGQLLSPYAVTKYVNELYAQVFARCYGTETVGLRYFNVFGSRQDPNSAYAAVIPTWVSALLQGRPVYINGTGETSRDFCYVRNVVQANLLAATVQRPDALNQVYNVAVGQRTSLTELFTLIRDGLALRNPQVGSIQPRFRDFREGDVLHSQADVSKASRLLEYKPTHSLQQGLAESLAWYERHATDRT